MNILITGLMGSGKSTQAKRLAQKLGLVFLTTGDVLREIAKESSKVGRYLNNTLSKGEMIDDKIVADLIKQRLDKEDAKAGFISDSYPRRLSQVELFDPRLDVIFYLKVDPEVAKERLLKRGRPDDTEELIDYRHQSQGIKITELVDYYRQKIPVYDIDANKSEDEVFAQIAEHIPYVS